MPSVSKKQHNLMAAVANNPKFAKKVGIKQSVGEEFISADKGKQFKSGGSMAESKKMVKKEVEFMKKKGAPKSMVKHEMSEMGMKKGGMAKTKKMAMGGMSSIFKGSTPSATSKSSGNENPIGRIVSTAADTLKRTTPTKSTPNENPIGRIVSTAADTLKRTTPTKSTPSSRSSGMRFMSSTKKMASGGSASSRADGIAVKGKTKGKMMAYGGKC